MSELVSRRELFTKKGLKKILKTSIKEMAQVKQEETWEKTLDQFSKPSIYSYALYSDFTREMIVEMANQRGIRTEGRSKSEIACDVFSSGEKFW